MCQLAPRSRLARKGPRPMDAIRTRRVVCRIRASALSPETGSQDQESRGPGERRAAAAAVGGQQARGEGQQTTGDRRCRAFPPPADNPPGIHPLLARHPHDCSTDAGPAAGSGRAAAYFFFFFCFYFFFIERRACQFCGFPANFSDFCESFGAVSLHIPFFSSSLVSLPPPSSTRNRQIE